MPFGLGGDARPSEVEGRADSSGGIDASTPWMAAADGNVELLKAALEHLCLSPSAADEQGYTLLQAAASYGQLRVVSWLLSSSQPASINAVDHEGDTALHYATTLDAAKFLLESGIDPTIRNREGKTALESKRDELQEAMDDDDYDEDDEDVTSLRSLVTYLSNSNFESRSQ
jgi:hypothetical protein